MKAWESVIVARLADNYEKSGLSDGEHNLLEIADRDLKAFRSKAPEVWQELYESDLDSRQIGDWIAGFLKKWSKSGMSLRNFALDELESGRVKLKKSVLYDGTFVYDRSNRTAGRRNMAGGKSALVERAVQAARLYMGADTASVATQQKLYRRMAAAVERVAKHYGMDAISASEQIEREARSRGPVRPLAGKDY